MQTDEMASTSVSVTSDEEAVLAAVHAALACDDVAGLATLMRTTSSLTVRKACCLALGNYARGHQADEPVAEEMMRDAIDALVHALCALPTSERVLSLCLCACSLWISQRGHQSRVYAGKAGAVGAAVVAMRAFAADANLQEFGCRFLNRLFLETPENAALAENASVIGAVLAAMQGHPDCREVQLYACSTLAHATERNKVITSLDMMTSGTSDGAMTNRGTAVALGAVELMAAKLLDADEDLSTAACNVLANLTPFSLEGRLRAQRCGALGNVLEMMRVSATNDYVQSAGCMALGTIIGSNCTIAVTAGLGACARTRIVNAMRQFPDDGAIQNNACCALSRLLLASPVPEYNAAHADDALACVVHALQAHNADPPVQLHACNALEKLVASQPANKAEAWRLGALPALVQVLETHVLSPKVVDSCLRALSSLVDSPVGLQCGAVNVIAWSRAVGAAMSAHSGVPNIQHVGNGALISLNKLWLQSSLGEVECGGERDAACNAREVDLQAREEAERRADAMAAALIAEEEAERAAKSPARSSKSGKKKRAGSGAGVASTAAAAPSIKVETAAAEAASAAASLAALTLDEHADDKSAPSAAALRRRRRAAAKAARKQSAGATEASGGQDDDAKGADTAAAVASLPSNNSQSDDDDDAAAIAPSTAASLSAVPGTLHVSRPPLPMAAAAFTPPPPSLKECCVCLIDIPAAERVVLVPCGHRCLCDECWRERLQPREPAARLCPICHAPVATAVRMFDA